MAETNPAGDPTPTYQPNMPGVKTFAGRLNSMGYDGNNVLNKFNQAAASGDMNLLSEKVNKLEALAQKVGYEGDLWGAAPSAKPAAAKAAAPVRSDLSEPSTISELGKAAWNGLADAVTGLARTPQILHDAAGAIYSGVGLEQDAGAKADSERLNKAFKGLGDSVADFVGKGTFALDKSGDYDKGIFEKDASGDWHINSLQGAAHSIGQSLGFVASMIGPGLAGKGAKLLGVGTSALRAAKAAGDVEKVAELTRAAQGTERAMRFVGGVTSQVEPLYQDALEATGDSHKAAAFTAAVAPVIAAIDAFTGIESMVGGSAGRTLSRQLVKEVIGRMGGEITEDTMKPLAKTFAEQWVKGRAKEGLVQTAVEGGTETIQEGYQVLVEKLFDRSAGNTKLADQGGAIDARLLNSLALGGLLGGSMGAVLHQSGAYHPTAFKVLQDAYQESGKAGLDRAVLDLQRGLTMNQAATVEQQAVLRGQVDRMASVIGSFKNPYRVDPKTQFQFYDIAYNQLPDQQQTLSDLQAQHDALTGEQPFGTDTDENGQPVQVPLDPIVAATQAAQLAPQLADQQRRVAYLSAVQNRLTSQSAYQEWAKGFDVIGKYQPGDRIVGTSLDDRSVVDGTVTGISEDGQTLTLSVPPAQSDQQPASVEVRALDAKPFEPVVPRSPDQHPDVAEAEVGAVSVGENLADGFITHQPDQTGAHPAYQTGQRVVLADDPSVSYPVETGTDAEGNQTLTIAHPDGPIQGTLAELTDKANPRRLLGTYSPEMALSRQDWKVALENNRQQEEKLTAKLPAATVTALSLMDEGQLRKRYEQLGTNKTDADQRRYVELLAQRNGWDVNTPEASPLAQREHTEDNLAADTPEADPAVLEPGEEVIDDQTFNRIIDTDEIPVEVIGGIAGRALTGQPLSERQQILFDGFTEEDNQLYLATLDAVAEANLTPETTPDESIQSTPTDSDPDPDRSPASGTGEDSQAGQGGSQSPGTESLPGLAGPVQPQLAEAAAPESAGTGSPAEPPATPGPAESNPNGSAPVSPVEAAQQADAEKAVQQSIAQEKARKARKKKAPQPAAPAQPAADAEADVEVKDAYEEERKVAAAESGAGELTDAQIAEQLRKIAGKGKGKSVADELGIDPDDLEDEDTAPAQPVYIGPATDGVATVGTKVKVLLPGGSATVGVVRGKNSEGDIVVRREGRNTTKQDDYPHQAGALLSMNGKPIAIDPDLPIPEPIATAVGRVDAGDMVNAPGVVSGTIVGKVESISPDGTTAMVQNLLTGKARPIEVKYLSPATAAEVKAVQKIITDRKGVVRRQVTTEADTTLPRTPPEALVNWISRLKKAFPRVKVELVDNAAMQARFGEALKGAVENGIVYINTESASADTPLHEFAHVYNAVAKKYSPQVYQRGLQLIDGSVYMDRVRALHPEVTSEEDIREEALAMAIGEMGVNMPSPTLVQRFQTWARLLLRRIGDALGMELGLETTLDDYLKARTVELLSGKVLSTVSSEELADMGVKTQRPTKATVALPTVMDEAWLAANGHQLTGEQFRDIANNYEQVYDPATDTYSQQRVDTAAETRIISDVQSQLDREGGLTKWLRSHANLLDHSNLGRILYGDSPQAGRFQAILRQQLAMVAPMKTAGHDAFQTFHKLLDGRSVFRGAMTWNTVEKWDLTGEVEGKSVRLQVPVDQVVHMAAQYRSTMRSKGHFDPRHTQKTAAGIEPTMGFRLPNVDNPDAPIFVRLGKAELRALEDRVFTQDAGTMALMDAWTAHSDRMFSPIARIHRLMTGKSLARLPDYFPLSPVSTSEEVMARSIDKFVDDAGLLKDRDRGASEWVSADGFLSSVSRYQREAENFVQLSPLWQNLKGVAVRQGSFLAGRGLASVTDALNRQAAGYQSPDAMKASSRIKLVGTYDVGKLLRLATLSRFAFNTAIPLKQITGFTSAFGSGAIDTRYLDGELPRYLKNIATSYGLLFRGSQDGGYFSTTTDADEVKAELASIDTPDGHVLSWRMQGQTHPDIHLDEWGSKRDVAGYTSQLKSKLRSFFEEYGLSISQRADTAVVGALYRAAKAQVKATNSGFTEQQIREEAATRAKEALYYSNQTFDRTDRASIQFAANPVEQLLLLYKGQGVKIFNTMARRSIEVAQASGPEKKAARLRMAGTLGLNAVLAPLITTAIDVGVTSLRNLAKSDDEKGNDQKTEHASYLDYGMAYLSSVLGQLFPAELGEAASAMAYMASNPSTKREFFNANPVAVVVDLFTAAGSLGVALTSKTYKSERDFQSEVVKGLQTTLRAGSVRAGVPMEATRQINHLLGNWLLPEAKPKAAHHGHARSHQAPSPEADYGLEYLTDTEEATDRKPSRRR